ncbi:MAG TPA: hypothetical protein VMR54_17960 [Thermoanaerobaculia bacterium]|nr:hypothetical protein [Thermoanaerobaculia bacterium]
MSRRTRILAFPSGALLLLAACSQGSPPGAAPPAGGHAAAPAPTSTAPSPTPAPPPPAAAVPAQPTVPASSSSRPYLEILKLQESGATEQQLLDKIRAENVRYRLTTAEVLELRQAGVSEAVVAAMLRSGP